MNPLKHAQLALAAHEAALAMHRDAGDKAAARSAQARVNGLRVKVIGLTNRQRELVEKLEWMKANKP